MNNQIFNIHDLVLTLSIIECFLIATIQAATLDRSKIDQCILCALTISIAASTSSTLLLGNENISTTQTTSMGIVYFFVTSQSLSAPLLYLYVKFSFKKDPSLNLLHLSHILPTLTFITITFIFPITFSDMRLETNNTSTISAACALKLSLKYVSLAYLGAAMITAWKNIKSHPSNDRVYSFSRSTWLKLLLSGFTIIWGWPLILQLCGLFISDTIAVTAENSFNYLFFIQINGILIYGIISYRNIIIPAKKQTTNIIKKVAPATILTSRKILEAEINNCHKDPNISVDLLSKRLGTTKRETSAAIKYHFNTTFIDFINSHRINTAKELLIDPQNSNTSIIDILYISGFNNVSSFYRYFNNKVGMTPKQFKRIHSSSANTAKTTKTSTPIN